MYICMCVRMHVCMQRMYNVMWYVLWLLFDFDSGQLPICRVDDCRSDLPMWPIISDLPWC